MASGPNEKNKKLKNKDMKSLKNSSRNKDPEDQAPPVLLEMS